MQLEGHQWDIEQCAERGVPVGSRIGCTQMHTSEGANIGTSGKKSRVWPEVVE